MAASRYRNIGEREVPISIVVDRGGRVAETGDIFVASTGDDVSAAELSSLTFEVPGAEGSAAAVDEGTGSLPHPNAAAVGDATVPLEATEVCLEWFFRAKSSEIETSVVGAAESQLKIFAPAAPPLRPSTTRPVIESSSIHRLTILIDCSRTWEFCHPTRT
ncbi:hypothetical protein HG530_008907 [Fusarium avenaceum]|nr:hypothetical protein HG530_008907 [Fusarium avenaceum]